MDSLDIRLQRAAVEHCPGLTLPRDLGLRLVAEVFASDGKEEDRWIEATQNACPACGGSGHKGDCAVSLGDAAAEITRLRAELAEVNSEREADMIMIIRLQSELAEARAENDRWRSAYGPFDECLINLSMLLIENDDFTDSNQTEPEEGTEEDYHAVCQNVLNAVRALIIQAQSAHAVGFSAGIEAAIASILKHSNIARKRMAECYDELDPDDYNGWGDIASHLDIELDAIRALTPPDITAAAAGVLLADDVALSKMAEAVHDGPLSADEYRFSAATPQGGWCVDVVRAALRALAEVKP